MPVWPDPEDKSYNSIRYSSGIAPVTAKQSPPSPESHRNLTARESHVYQPSPHPLGVSKLGP